MNIRCTTISWFCYISIYWKSSFSFSVQNKNTNTVLGADLIYYLGRQTMEKIDLKIGLFARLRDAFNFTVGMNHDNWSIDLGYDLNVSGLTSASQTRGAFEISIGYVNRVFKGADRKSVV